MDLQIVIAVMAVFAVVSLLAVLLAFRGMNKVRPNIFEYSAYWWVVVVLAIAGAPVFIVFQLDKFMNPDRVSL